MRASLNLIKKYVDLDGLSVQEIVDKLTFSGLEVEEVSKVADATNLVIGQIVSCEKHPDSDHLHVLKVDLGPKYGIKQIVCGAPNARTGLKVIVARVGAGLKKAKVTINSGIIRGVTSEGMCCALYELGVDKNFLNEKQVSGIEELDENAPVGEENVLEYLGLDDYILDINVLANRSDCLAIYSLAKELGALFDRKVNIPEYHFDNELNSNIKVSSLTSDCPQFSVKEINDITVKESPKWLKSFLISSGIRSINNIVDIGNYVMLLTGQPLHMYDKDKLTSDEFIVRNDVECDFTALDDKTYQIKNGDLCVTVDNKVCCLGGIMGGKNCQVDENTKNVIVESANFLGSTIRRTSVRIGLSSESSAHFVKGIDPYQDEEVLSLAANLLVELADAKIIYKTNRYTTLDYSEIEIPCSYSYINKRLGYEFSVEQMNDVFRRLDIKIKNIDEDNFIAYPPHNRIDLRCDANLSEEIFRFIGLDTIKPKLPEMVTTVGGLSRDQQLKKNIREHLISHSFNEILTYTLISPELNDKFVVLNNDEAIKIKNPMTVEHSLVRRSLVASCLEIMNYNLAHQNKDLRLFEISDVTTDKQTYQELCCVLNGNREVRSSLEKTPFTFYDIKGVFESIMQILGLDFKRYKIERLDDSPYYHPGRSAKVIVNKKVVAVFGEIHPNYNKEYGVCYILDMNLSEFLSLRVSQKKMQQISRFPSIERDYAFVVNKNVSSEQIINVIKKESRGIIEDINIFDVYEGEFLPVGFKSLAVAIKYSSLDRTLKDEDINPVEEKFISSLNNQYKVYLRS